MITDTFVQSQLLQYELEKEVTKLRSALRLKNRFGDVLPQNVADVAEYIYKDRFQSSTEGITDNIIATIIKTIKAIVRAIIDLVERLHKFIMRQVAANRASLKTVDSFDDRSEMQRTIASNLRGIIPPNLFWTYLTAAANIRDDLNDNAIIIAHLSKTANKTATNKALNLFGYSFTSSIEVVSNGRGGVVGGLQPDDVMATIRAKFTTTSDKGWTITDIQHMYREMVKFNAGASTLDHNKVRRFLDAHVARMEAAINTHQVDPIQGNDDIVMTTKWLMMIFNMYAFMTQALNAQIKSAVDAIAQEG